MSPFEAGALAFLGVLLIFVPWVYIVWPRGKGFIDGDKHRTFEHVRCPRCGQPVLVDAMPYHQRRCPGVLRSERVGTSVPRRW